MLPPPFPSAFLVPFPNPFCPSITSPPPHKALYSHPQSLFALEHHLSPYLIPPPALAINMDLEFSSSPKLLHTLMF